jgi:hypothetical protein
MDSAAEATSGAVTEGTSLRLLCGERRGRDELLGVRPSALGLKKKQMKAATRQS